MSRARHLFTASLLTIALIFTGIVAFNDYTVTHAAPSIAIASDGNDSSNRAFGLNSHPPHAQNQQSANGLWEELDRERLGLQLAPGVPEQSRMFRLDGAALAELLKRAPSEKNRDGGESAVLLTLPFPDGAFTRFRIEESSVLATDLAELYPEIRSYRGQGIDDPALTMRCDLTPQGFHASMLLGDQIINLHPAGAGDASIYVSYFGSDIQNSEAQCLVKEIHSINPGDSRTAAPQTAVGPSLRNYRIAIAADWEYCNQYGAGTTAGTIASINTWLNAANLIYEREFAIHFNLVNDTDVIYSTDRGFTAATDPYDNTNVSTMLNQVRPNLSTNVGQANYDIGHVFGQIGGTGGSGIAFVGVVCSGSDIKGGGATLVGGTVGNSTALGVWVHELGHQSGASHSFNGTLGNCGGGNRSSATSWESGGGQTIMSYAATCLGDNITNTPVMRFHAGSYTQITNYMTASTGSTCAALTSTGNNAPTVNGGPDLTIPKSTPFTLTASGSDADAADLPNLTYAWDQVDSGGSAYPQNGTSASYNDAADPATSTRPIFRPFSPSASNSRTFPSLTYIRNNLNDPPDVVSGLQTAEELPRIGRSLNFRVTIRDNRASGGGVNEDSVLLTVSGTSGPFLVTAPNTAVTWTGGTTPAVTWSVNNTNAAPVSCANVKISLSTDSGSTFPNTLLASTPNDGSEPITVPGISSTTARIKVEAVGNIFFDMSDTNFTINGSCPAITLSPTTIADGTVNSSYSQTITASGGTAAYTYSLSVGALPNGLTLSSAGVISGTPTQGGSFNMTVKATDASLCTGTRAYILTINCQAITLTPASLAAGSMGTSYSQALTATGGTPGYAFSVTSGTLPGGVTLSGGGVLSGTPTTQGTFNFTVTANDAGSCAGNRGYTLTINSPSAISLISFTASTFDHSTLLEWQTGFEADNLGFNVYRDDGNGRRLVNQQLVAGSALTAGSALSAGQSYAWWDKGVADCGLGIADCKNTGYWLEDVDLKGTSTWHGPFLAKPTDGATVARTQAATLSKLAGPEATGDATRVVEAVAPLTGHSTEQSRVQSLLAAESAVKIFVKREGWYRISQVELVAAGLAKDADPERLQLFADGLELPIIVSAGKNGRFDETAFIEFYGVGIDTPSSDARAYWLVAGRQAGKRVIKEAGQGIVSVAASYTQTVERKERTIYFAALKNGERENFFGAVIAGQLVEQSINLSHVARSAEPAVVVVSLQGVTKVPHRVRVEINDSDAGYLTFDGQALGVQAFTIGHELLREGANVIRLTAQNGASDVSLVDRIRVSYQHAFACDEDSLKLTANGGEQVTLRGFTTPNVRVFDVTEPDSVKELLGVIEADESGGFAITVSPLEKGARTLIALTDEQAKAPISIAADRASGWRGANQSADIVIVTRGEFFPVLESLKALRQRQGYVVALVDIEDVYDEFNFGNKSSQAIKDFLGFAVAHWKLAPQFVLLAADASYDPKDHLGLGDNDLVPTALVDTEYLETASDEWLADFDNDGLAELAIGRLPVRTANEALMMAAKIIAYEKSRPSQEVLLVSDKNDGYDFETASSRLMRLLPASLRVSRVDRARTTPEVAKANLLEAINRGQKIVNYLGHGSVDLWSGSLLTISDAQALPNNGRLPVFVMMTCLNGYFQNAATDSLGEALMKAPGGAVAVWASTGMTTPADQSRINEELYRLIFAGASLKGRPLTLGEATTRAKASVMNWDVRRTWVLLGDPAMVLR
ncbi:MAG: C25 family cysteine peptidase [Acidobacteriota bacterium]